LIEKHANLQVQEIRVLFFIKVQFIPILFAKLSKMGLKNEIISGQTLPFES
jgi:hypothetical protein